MNNAGKFIIAAIACMFVATSLLELWNHENRAALTLSSQALGPLFEVRYKHPTVAICTVATDDADIREWAYHYKDLGVSNLLVYQHASTGGIKRSLQPLVDIGFVKLHDALNISETIQLDSFNDCLETYRSRFDVLGFFDIDEYAILRQDVNLPALLHKYRNAGGLVLNWRGFGSNGFENRQASVRGSFFQCFPESHNNNWHVKTLANTKFISKMVSPHFAEYFHNYAVNTGFQRCDGPFSKPAVFDVAHLNHYGLRSREDYAVRLARMSVDKSKKDWQYFDRVNAEATEECHDFEIVEQ